MNNKNIILIVGLLLLGIGLFGSKLFEQSSVILPKTTASISEPKDTKLRDLCVEVTNALKSGGSSRFNDGKKLCSLYLDLADLIKLDGEDEIIKTTEEIRQANRLSGLLLHLKIRDKYDHLAERANDVISYGIGDNVVQLDKELRQKAVESFQALAWACNEGAK